MTLYYDHCALSLLLRGIRKRRLSCTGNAFRSTIGEVLFKEERLVVICSTADIFK